MPFEGCRLLCYLGCMVRSLSLLGSFAEAENVLLNRFALWMITFPDVRVVRASEERVSQSLLKPYRPHQDRRRNSTERVQTARQHQAALVSAAKSTRLTVEHVRLFLLYLP